jgi:cobalamin biosynthesis protein CbiD
MTSSQLNLLCQIHGKTVSAEVVTDAHGRSLEFGIAEMESEEDAREVIVALDGTDELDGTSRILYVARISQQDGPTAHTRTSEHHHQHEELVLLR